MRSSRSILFVVSVSLVMLLLGGGLVVKVGASESSYNQVVTFSEILSLVMDNYVDPVDPDKLLVGAYEGMLAGLDPNGAFLTPEEVAKWKSRGKADTASPGVSVLKAGRALQIVAVDEGSPAEDAGIAVGDHIRSVDGQSVRDLSLTQAWQLLRGKTGTTVRLDLVHPLDGFSRESIEVTRAIRRAAPYRLEIQRGIAVVRLYDMNRLVASEVAAELEDVRSRGVEFLLLDLRNLADLGPRDVVEAASLFSDGPLLRLRDRAGRLIETVGVDGEGGGAWPGSIATLVNGATAGSAEALASVLQAERGGIVLGETTYGLGAEVKLFELEDGSGLLVSSALWETVAGESWNEKGVEPDEVVNGKGTDYPEISADQLEKALDLLEQRVRDAAEEAEAA